MKHHEMASDDVLALVKQAMNRWHPDQVEGRVRVGVIMTSNEDGNAVTLGGYPCQATMRIVPTKDRLIKNYEAEMEIDQENWDGLSQAKRLALVDHELSHVLVVRKCGIIAKDSLGLPKLKLRGGDWNVGDGFADVVARHGEAAAEFTNLTRTYQRAIEAKERGEQ